MAMPPPNQDWQQTIISTRFTFISFGEQTITELAHSGEKEDAPEYLGRIVCTKETKYSKSKSSAEGTGNVIA